MGAFKDPWDQMAARGETVEDRMNSEGGVGPAPKYRQATKHEDSDKWASEQANDKDAKITGFAGEMADTEGKFKLAHFNEPKLHPFSKTPSYAGKKGEGSLEPVTGAGAGDNEGENMMLEGNEHNRP